MATNSLGGVNLAQVAQTTLASLVAKLPLLSVFATDLSAETISGASITTRVCSALTFGSLATGVAAAQNAVATPITVTMSEPSGIVIGFTENEWMGSGINLNTVFIKPAVNACAGGIVDAALGLVTLANYGAAGFTGPANEFDSDAIEDLAAALSVAKAGSERSMLLNGTYFSAAVKSDTIRSAMVYGGTEVVRYRQIPALSGFVPIAEYAAMPANGQNLVGVAMDKTAIVIATRLPATPAGFNGEIEVAQDPESGLAVQLRRWYSQDDMKYYLSAGVRYGVAKGNATALLRIVSA